MREGLGNIRVDPKEGNPQSLFVAQALRLRNGGPSLLCTAQLVRSRGGGRKEGGRREEDGSQGKVLDLFFSHW